MPLGGNNEPWIYVAPLTRWSVVMRRSASLVRPLHDWSKTCVRELKSHPMAAVVGVQCMKPTTICTNIHNASSASLDL